MFKNSAFKKNSLLIIDFIVMFIIQLASIVLITDKTGAELFSVNNIAHMLGFAILNIICMALFGTYNIIWRYARFVDLFKCGAGVLCGSVIFCFYSIVAKLPLPFNFVYSIIGFSFSAVVIVGIRLIYRIVYETMKAANIQSLGKNRTLIIGAGVCGRAVLSEMSETDTPYFPSFAENIKFKPSFSPSPRQKPRSGIISSKCAAKRAVR